MEARFLRAALIVVAALMSLGAGRPYHSIRSQHFVVSAPTPQLAQEICQAAEQYRRDLAIEWLGHELPPWNGLCPIKADVAPGLGAGGATSFVFQNNTPGQWTMSIQGSRERILDSVLPHEITHTIFATHFGRPLPRWADEGACTTVEHPSEKAKQDNFLIQFLTTDRGIPFNHMFKLKEYPPDILPLYSQGYSLAKFLIEQGGKQKFVEYVGEGMRSNNWTATTQRFYGFNSLSDLQLTWVEWVRHGSPALPEGKVPEMLLVSTQGQSAGGRAAASAAPTRNIVGTQMASLTQQPRSRVPDGALASWQTTQSQNARVFVAAEQMEAPPQVANSARPAVVPPTAPAADYSQVSRPVAEGWYAKRRDQAQAAQGTVSSEETGTVPRGDATATGDAPGASLLPAKKEPINALPMTPVSAATPNSRIVLEWTRQANETGTQREEMTGVALIDKATLLR